MIFKKTALSTAIALMTAGLVACGGGDATPAPMPASTPMQVGDAIALTASGKLISFNRATPGTMVGSTTVSGLAANETLVGIDFRPLDAKLYGVGSRGSVYTVEPSTGVATLEVALKALAGDDNPFTALAGTVFAVDFNPAADRLRLIGSKGQNLRINVDTGDTTTDGTVALAGGATTVGAAAYTNAFLGTSTTQLFDIDFASGLLHLQSPPNDGTLVAGVPLGVAATGGEFDIDARTNTGYAALTVGGTTSLYTVNLAPAAGASAATVVAAIAGGEAIKGLALALAQAAAPSAIGLTADNRLGAGETVVGIDVRPSDGVLYALTTAGKVYTVGASTGVATLKSTLAADPADITAAFTALVGAAFSVDFNPVVDRLRVVSETGQNLRVNVDTGLTTTDTDLTRASAPASVLASAYTNSFAGTTATALFNLVH